MDESLRATCQDFIDYRDLIRDSFVWSGHTQLFPLCAYIFLNHHQEPNEEMMKLCRKILRENNSFISSFRGNGELIFTSLLATETDPGWKMQVCMEAYQTLRKYFTFSQYLPLLAMIMPDKMPVSHFDWFAQRTKELYQKMNDTHPFLTNSEDVIFAGLMAMSNKEPEEQLEETEAIYNILKGSYFFHKNAVQSLSHALTLCSGKVISKCECFDHLCELLDHSGLYYGKESGLTIIGILANLGIDHDLIVQDMKDVYEYLGSQQGYGFFGFAKKARFMHAALILCAYYISGTLELSCAVIVGVLMEIEAEQAAAAAA